MVQRTPQVHRRKANRARSSGATPVKRYGLIAFFTTFLFVMTPPGIIVNLGDGLGTEVSWYLRYGAIAVALLCYIAKGCRKAFYVLALAYGILSFGTMFLGDAPLFWAIRVAFPCSAIVLLVGAFGRDRYEELLWGLLISMSVYSLLNALVLVFVPPTVPLIHESTSYTFLGNRNGFSRVYLPSIIASCLLDALQGKRFSLRSGVLTGAAIIQACLFGYIGRRIGFCAGRARPCTQQSLASVAECGRVRDRLHCRLFCDRRAAASVCFWPSDRRALGATA